MNRRGFLTGLTCIAASAAVADGTEAPSRAPQSEKGAAGRPPRGPRVPAPVAPPGAGSIKHLLAHCTGCGLCVAKCPHQAIVPAALDYGLGGLMMPKLDFTHGYCEYHCHTCSHVCPAGALLPLGHDQKIATRLGEAVYIQHHCVVETDKVTCGICAEHCPTHAITLVKAADGRSRPQVDKAKCIGCGTCEYFCPAKHKAMRVKGFAEHRLLERGNSPAKAGPEKPARNNRRTA